MAILVLLVIGGGVALWRSRSPAETAGSLEATRSCLESKPGYRARENDDATGARQLMVTTPVGRTTHDGNITMTHDSSATVIFFKTQEDANGWVDALQDISSSQVGGAAPNELVGSVLIGWSVPAPDAEIATVRGCVSG